MRRIAALTLLLCAAAAAGDLELDQTVSPEFPLSEWRIWDVNRDGRSELLLIGSRGEVRSWATDEAGRLEAAPRGALTLDQPRYTLLTVADFLRNGWPPQLLALTPRGALLYPAGADGAFSAEPKMLARRAKFRLRTNEPLIADVVQDVNSDGWPDLVVPGSRTTELWIRRGDRYARAAEIQVDVSRSDRMRAEDLSDRLSSAFRIPQLKTSDVNGDGRRDLLVRAGRTRAFHIQREDGTIPAEPDSVVDLTIFRDTTPRASLRPGRTLAGSDKARYESRDLDADGIPDYVIAHRRKVWVFHGNREKPQFTEPTTILKVSDDITMLMVLDLDEDRLPDLLLFKVQVPTVAQLVVGLLQELEIEISSLGYRNRNGRTFEHTPQWRSTLVVRIPAITKILKDPGALLKRIEDVGKKFRPRRMGDLDGDGKRELILMSEDKTHLEVWLGTKGKGEENNTIRLDKAFRRVLFEDQNKTWDFDRILDFFSSVAEQRTTTLTGGRDPDLEFRLRDPGRFDYLDFAVGSLDGKPRESVVIRYLPKTTGMLSIFDILKIPGP